MRCLTTWTTPLLQKNLKLWKKDLEVLRTSSGECRSGRQWDTLEADIRLHQDMIALIEAILASRA